MYSGPEWGIGEGDVVCKLMVGRFDKLNLLCYHRCSCEDHYPLSTYPRDHLSKARAMTRLQIKMFILLILCLVRVIDTSMDPANQGESSKIAGFPVRFVKHNQRQEPSSKSKRFDYRWGLSTPINFNILQVPENTTLLSRTYEKQMPSLRLTKQGQAFNSSGKDSPNSSSDEARALDCPISCICTYRSDRTVDIVDCSNKGLTKIPVLPVSSRGVYLQNNNIRRVPCTSFGSLKLLKKLDLSENQIATLPRCSFANTRTLQLLRLSRCQLTSLQEGVFNSLQNLLQLDLSENNINNMEQNLFTNLNKLESLDLSKNKITRVRNDTFRGLNSLMFLSLQKNVLYYLLETFESNAFKGLDSLQSLYLEGNQPYLPDNFKYPDQALAQIPTLRRVWLDGYPRKLGPGFSSLVNLSHLSFASGNGGFCSMKSNMPEHFFIHLKTKQPLNLNMSLCDISEISPVVLNHVPTIHTLDLSSNQDLSIDGFEKASKGLQNTTITVLNIGRSLASDADGVTFSTLTLLENLDLRYNSIDDLSEDAFKNNMNLEVLDLSHNKITQFRPSLANNMKLKLLDLSSNHLGGISERTCLELQRIKKNSSNFTVMIEGNNFLCQCDKLYFLNFLLGQPEIFEDVENAFHCQLTNGSIVNYGNLAAVMPQIGLQCFAQTIFLCTLVAFFLVTGGLAIFGLYHFKRWQWIYLYYVGRSRLHIGSTQLTHIPRADVFFTYDQENPRLRRMVRYLFLPRLQQIGLTIVLGETDFCGGPLGPSIASAVTNTGKTLVFLSKDIFKDYHRQLEVNLAIMHELYLRSPVLVPVLLGYEAASTHQALSSASSERNGRKPNQRYSSDRMGRITNYSDSTRFVHLLRDFPPEISTFLRGQIHRCLVYTGDTSHFWQHLKDVIKEN
ncbi:hypothetical protein RRG08_003715 [Elysia crispata]|uniref:LRRNT domain-containing protein n=1 Tax=Elysia crispata TaxID=231223 RepID=A0AAE1E543_9GAST|nr:hypothetical protein RRG08_003715 [Elysia crispata]